MKRKPRPAKPDPRPAWMIEQAARCGCRGTDDMCPCQNENPWPRASVDWEARATELAEALGPFVARFIDRPDWADEVILSVGRFNVEPWRKRDMPMFKVADLRRASPCSPRAPQEPGDKAPEAK
jgi:hypothetical protein